jgi:hypothetical protein
MTNHAYHTNPPLLITIQPLTCFSSHSELPCVCQLLFLWLTLELAAGSMSAAGESFTSNAVIAGGTAMAFQATVTVQAGTGAHAISTSGLASAVDPAGATQRLLLTLSSAMFAGDFTADPPLMPGAFTVTFGALPFGVTISDGDQQVRLHAAPSVPHCDITLPTVWTPELLVWGAAQANLWCP